MRENSSQSHSLNHFFRPWEFISREKTISMNTDEFLGVITAGMGLVTMCSLWLPHSSKKKKRAHQTNYGNMKQLPGSTHWGLYNFMKCVAHCENAYFASNESKNLYSSHSNRRLTRGAVGHTVTNHWIISTFVNFVGCDYTAHIMTLVGVIIIHWSASTLTVPHSKKGLERLEWHNKFFLIPKYLKPPLVVVLANSRCLKGRILPQLHTHTHTLRQRESNVTCTITAGNKLSWGLTSGPVHCLFHLCLQTVAEVWGHPENFIVLSQQSSGERGRRMHTKQQPPLFIRETNQWNNVCIVVKKSLQRLYKAVEHRVSTLYSVLKLCLQVCVMLIIYRFFGLHTYLILYSCIIFCMVYIPTEHGQCLCILSFYIVQCFCVTYL